MKSMVLRDTDGHGLKYKVAKKLHTDSCNNNSLIKLHQCLASVRVRRTTYNLKRMSKESIYELNAEFDSLHISFTDRKCYIRMVTVLPGCIAIEDGFSSST